MLEPLDLKIEIPAWIGNFVARSPKVFAAVEDRMRFVIALARENVERKSCGSFGAAGFDAAGTLVAPGINIVLTNNCSILHAEMIAIAMAKKKLGRYDIGNGGTSRYELVASAEPCAMCFGAVHWSGVSRLVCGARDEDSRRIGFDEGPKLSGWQDALEDRGIHVARVVLRKEAVEVLD